MPKTKTRLPYYPMYAADFLTSQSVELMSLAARGLYITLLNRAWIGDGLPDDVEQIQRLAHATDVEFKAAWAAVSQHFPAGVDGRLRNPRQEIERGSAAEAHQRRVDAAKARWNAMHMQGNDALHMQSESESESESEAESEAEAEAHARLDSGSSPQGQNENQKESARALFSSESFGAWWDRYPKQARKPAAQQAYSELITTPELHTELMAGTDRWISSAQWRDSDGGRYIPDPARFIREARWREHPPQAIDTDDPFESAKKLLEAQERD